MPMIIIDPLVGCHYNAICHGTFLGCLANDGVDVFLYPPSLSSQGSQLVSSQFNSWTGNWIENFAHLYSASDLNLEIPSIVIIFCWMKRRSNIDRTGHTHWAPLLSIDGVLVVCCFVRAVKKEIQEAVMPSRHIGQLAVSRSSQTANARFSSSRRNIKSKILEILLHNAIRVNTYTGWFF